MRAKYLTAAAVLLLAGCPSDDEAAWSLVLDGESLDRVVLSAWSSGPDDVYGVGGGLGNGLGGLVVHYDGSRWNEIATGSDDTFWWTFGADADNVYFVGEQGAIYHSTPSGVTEMTTPTTHTLYGIWGTSPTSLWAVGGDPLSGTPAPVILYYDGTDWTDQTPTVDIAGALFKVWGASANDVYAVGQGGTILHYDGSEWTAEDSGTTSTFFTVHGQAGGEIYAVGGPPALIVTRGDSGWERVDTGLAASLFNGVAVGANGEVVVVGMSGIKFRLRDGEWLDETFEQPIIDLHAVWIDDSDNTYAVGGNFYAPGTPSTVRIGIVGYYGTDAPGSDF
jgi:hypothetical protein